MTTSLSSPLLFGSELLLFFSRAHKGEMEEEKDERGRIEEIREGGTSPGEKQSQSKHCSIITANFKQGA